MGDLSDIFHPVAFAARHRPWARLVMDGDGWNAAVAALAEGQLDLLSLWADGATVLMALRRPGDGAAAVISLDCPDGRFPSVGARHAPAIRLERTISDLFGLVPDGAADTRSWLDHGRWGVRHPLGDNRPDAAGGDPYPLLAAEGEGLHQIPVGPVHAGIIEPGHFRFTASGETVVRLEARLGYVHKGIDRLMAGTDVARAARIACRTSGDSMVGYGLAFARSVEAALDADVPARAHWLRALMAEIERLANHLGDIGAICNDAAFALMQAHCAVLRERTLRAAHAAFGHRLMRDCVVPGGVAADLAPQGAAEIGALVSEIRRRFPPLVSLYDNTASLQDRTVGTGIVSAELVQGFAAGGYVGRASGRDFDARRTLAYPPYDQLAFDVPVRAAGDVDARVWVRILEIGQSLGLVEQILTGLPDGPVRTALPTGGGEGMAVTEGFRGDILAWVRIGDDGAVARCHLRDPSWFQWPLLEVAIDGNIVADFPLCNKSFNCSYSGVDL